MPSKNRAKKISNSLVARLPKPLSGVSTSGNKTQLKISPPKYLQFLATLFFAIWILVGIFFLIFIYGNWRQGAFRGLLAKPQPVPQQQSQAPAETDLPGVGKVNITCVQNSLSTDAIQKIVQSGNTSTLTDDEKAKLEPCIIQKEEASSTASPSPNQ